MSIIDTTALPPIPVPSLAVVAARKAAEKAARDAAREEGWTEAAYMAVEQRLALIHSASPYRAADGLTEALCWLTEEEAEAIVAYVESLARWDEARRQGGFAVGRAWMACLPTGMDRHQQASAAAARWLEATGLLDAMQELIASGGFPLYAGQRRMAVHRFLDDFLKEAHGKRLDLQGFCEALRNSRPATLQHLYGPEWRFIREELLPLLQDLESIFGDSSEMLRCILAWMRRWSEPVPRSR